MTPRQPRSPHEIGRPQRPAPPPASHRPQPLCPQPLGPQPLSPQPLSPLGEIAGDRAESQATSAWLAHLAAGRLK